MDNLVKLGYIGNVEVKLKINGKLYSVTNHNEGLNYLKYVFAVLLSGNDIGTAYSPQFVDLRKEYDVEGESVLTSYFNFFSEITAKRYYAEDEDWIAEFTAVISSEQLLQTVSPDDTSNYYLYLISGYDPDNEIERQHDLARLKIDARTLALITPGITATLVWSVKLVNVNEGEE